MNNTIQQAKPSTVTNAKCFRSNDAFLKTPITIAEVHSDWLLELIN